MTPKYGQYQSALWFAAGVLVTTVVFNNWLLVGAIITAGLVIVYVLRALAATPETQPANVIPVGLPHRKTTY